MGRLIVLDGLDGCGKSTQGERVARALRERGERVQLISFPDYAEPSSTLVKMYLAGEFSENPDDINAYAAGSFYAVDRYASYMLHWKKEYEAGAHHPRDPLRHLQRHPPDGQTPGIGMGRVPAVD